MLQALFHAGILLASYIGIIHSGHMENRKIEEKKSMHAALTVPAAVERCHGGGDVTAVTKFFFFFLELDELSVAVLKRNTTLPVASHSLSTTK